MTWQIECTALLFDMDGTLVDSTPCIEGLWRRWAVRQHLDPDLVMQHVHGRRGIETIALVAPHLDAAAEVVELLKEEARSLDGTVAIDGAADFLAQLRPDQWAVVTSAPREIALAKLTYAGLPAPARLISADDVTHGKPHPEAFLKGAALFGLDPQQCVAFEDALSGVQSAQAAGIPVIALTSSHSAQELSHAEHIIANYHSLTLKVGDRIVISGLSQ
ncbi:HAD-IA family hydrolase [Iodobacter fluviatilis]|uniref:Phosphatase YfbT n=1 Tax=Iodobacter fluviatilis TaxID=537 RepID=A0A377T0F9_9NEIS|nr:HAD-IA family hydrolase [Iodobacter fluviatilis]TCU88616.1 sugar-phosphatase [Iodobacter fluviatilis]STQ91313.1 Phosphatase YfbT [Iodobacter fluviatilis]STR46066.1 Phosphatase YfbT [Iodobacter fluviatilis]